MLTKFFLVSRNKRNFAKIQACFVKQKNENSILLCSLLFFKNTFSTDKPRVKLTRTSSGGSNERKETILSCHVEGNPEPQVSCHACHALHDDYHAQDTILSCHVEGNPEPHVSCHACHALPDDYHAKETILSCHVEGNNEPHVNAMHVMHCMLYIMQKKTIFSCHVDGNLEPQVSIQLKLVAFHVMP
jgi:hypothetical protein